MKRRPVSRSGAGFTLLEVVLSAFLLVSMMLVAGLVTDRTWSLFRQSRAEQEVSSDVGRLVQRMASELAFAGGAGLDPRLEPPLASATLRYRVCQGFDEELTWGATRTLRFEYDEGELDDGLDNDGDGLVDEGAVVWIEDEGQPGERRAVWGHGVAELLAGEELDDEDDNGNGLVDEQGLCFTVEDGLLTIRLTLQGVGPGGNVITKTMETSVFVRN